MKRKTITRRLIVVVAATAVTMACGSESANPHEQISKPKQYPVVNDSRNDLVLSWFDDEGAKTASTVAEIPDDSKKKVRVQDPSIPPEKSDSRWLFMADLTKKDKKGHYTVTAVLREKYEEERRPSPAAGQSETQQSALSPEPTGNDESRAVMYATTHCPVCHKARRWLLNHKIPYVEIDLEKDRQAAAALAEKGRAQGVSTSGVPIFEVHGKLIPGFQPEAIKKALASGPRKATTVPSPNTGIAI